MTRPNTYSQTVNGMLNKLKMLNVVTDNIANIGTSGYKREIPETVNFKSVMNEVALRDGSQGPLKRTGNQLDIAIEGNAFILVESKDGPIPTRNGKLGFNDKGSLVIPDGHEVIIVEKTDKPISLTKQYDIRINENGEIFAGGERYGRIAMKIMDNKPVKLHQGFIEGSNVNLMSEMVALLLTFRSFEASEKALGMEASVDKELVEKYGRNV
ncbi:MAG: hypothetical protein A3I68_06095 [Candidatus Melainabacteria bacterium RIFCSPLOWO2_02_FULL_35_15]|nr:MAG: hypothetical protein A3F80_02075 [Candidatus Melainabacteria bacterium RIFCSPLOWO2_12_FULL_35_11]OGI13773.1 MAG: hypothetical protein A3I68_06095 [Candidatus Melainabacteria bacterium RIFCSPLOWO2_02_FULL_35_15]